MAILVNVLCFIGGSCFGFVIMSLFVAASRDDERNGLK